MNYFSTRNRNEKVSFRDAVIKGLAPDGGLYMPETIPSLTNDFFHSKDISFHQIAFDVLSHYAGNDICVADLSNIIESAFTFDAPVKNLDDKLSFLELYHGPTLAFKDFGARFMAHTLGHFAQQQDEEVIILVATSGDTGSAVASGFYKTPGVRVVILFPAGKVSAMQQKQLTTLGENITALEIDGVFDDCQTLVKTAFADSELNIAKQLSSANSINIARLLPQSLYYFSSYFALKQNGKPIHFCVPSGNFGNLTGGLIAQRMGLPVSKFIASTNINDVVPKYIHSGIFEPRPSVRTLSNAMDVGNPSNFERMMDIFQNNVDLVRSHIIGKAYTDEESKHAIKEVYEKYGYVIEPHGAVGYCAAKDFIRETNTSERTIILETAHPAKFNDTVQQVLHEDIAIPERLNSFMDKEEKYISMRKDYEEFKEFLRAF